MKFRPPHYLKKVFISPTYWLTFVIFFSFQLVGQVNSNHYKFISPNEAPGFPNAEITCLFQDSYGFVWIGTTEGLYRFNGYECTLFESIPGDTTSLPSNFITYHAFYEDPQHNLWIATAEAGFVKFDRKTERFQRFQNKEGNPNSLSFNKINVIKGDGKDGIWVGTIGKGLDHFYPNSKQFKNYRLPDGFSDTLMGSNLMVDLSRTKKGDLWIGTDKGLAKLNRRNEFHRYFVKGENSNGLTSNFVFDIFEDSKNRIWVATLNGLNRWVRQDSFVHYFPNEALQLRDKPQHNLIFRVFEDHTGVYWLGTNGGLLTFDPDKKASYQLIPHYPDDPFSIQKGRVLGILEDKQHNLWFVAKEGLSILNKKRSIFQDGPDLVNAPVVKLNSYHDVQDLLRIGDKLWVSTSQGLFICQENKPLLKLLEGSFTILFLAKNGYLYAGTEMDSFYIVDPSRKQVLDPIQKARNRKSPHDHSKLIGLKNTCFAQDDYGSLWMGTLNTLNRYDHNKRVYRQFYNNPEQIHGISNTTINDLKTDKKGRLWIATNAGVNVLSKKELNKPIEDTLLYFQHFRHDPQNPNTIGSDKVNCIFEDSRGWFWFGTELGVSILYPNGRWKHLTRRDGLPGNKVTRIVADHAGNIWIATENHGLARYGIHGHLQNFGQADGLFSERFPSGAMRLDATGQLILASTGGIQYLNPQKIKPGQVKKPLYLTQVKLFNRPVAPGGKDGLLQQAAYLSKKIILAYHQDVLTLQFTTLNFTNSDKQVYRYRLAGFKSLEHWQYLGTQRDIHLTNLFPGKYTLEVESTTNPDRRAHWESRNTLFIQVKWPWFWQWWAILLYLLSAAALVRLAYLFRMNLKRNQELKQKSQGYDYVTHEFRTPLTIILGMVDMIRAQPSQWLNDGLDKIQRNSVMLLHLVNQLLDISRFDAGLMQKVNWEQGDILPFLRYLHESFSSYAKSKGIEMEFATDLDTLIMDFDPDKLQKIVSNVLSNALKFTPSGGTVYLKIEQTAKNQLSIEIKDTGPGIAKEDLQRIFDRFVRVGDALKFQGIGIGLALTKELIQLLGGQIKVSSRLGEGAIFTILLPIHRLASEFAPIPEPSLPPVPPLAQVPEQHTKDSDLPLVLIVEDNPDLVDYLRACLQNNYNITVAVDGEEGIQKAFEIGPDIVISDVMMPRKDGFELCSTLKNDLRSSHIPIILLTALSETEDRLRGLEDGADAYLSKPFLQKELEICMRKALELRQKIKDYFTPLNVAEAKLAPFSIQKEHNFFHKLDLFLEANYAKALSIGDLGAAMKMNENQLRYKLKALKSVTPQKYLLRFRLEKAQDLILNDHELTIKEISYKTGFSDPAHFSNAFHKEFGQWPSDLRPKL